jgi:hypothetical protein
MARQEDEQMVELVQKYGTKKWSAIAKELPGRLGKQCRERWYNHLDPDINKDAWTAEEDRMVLELRQQLGNRWAEIARRMRGRCVGGGWAGPGRRASTRGPVWTSIAAESSIATTTTIGRTDNAIKNRWNSTLCRVAKEGGNKDPTARKRGRQPREASSASAHPNNKPRPRPHPRPLEEGPALVEVRTPCRAVPSSAHA